ncbi:Propeller, partial [Ancylostoma duodenale]
VSNSGADYANLPKHWVSDHVVIASTSHYRDAKWRKQILEDLCAVNEACWEAFKSMSNELGDLIDDEVKSDSWNHKVRAKLRLAGERRFVAGMIYLSVEQMMFQPNSGNTVVKSLTEVTSAAREFDPSTSTFIIRTSFCGESLELGFSEECDRDEWHEFLEQESFANVSYPTSLSIPGCMKSVSAGAEGVVWAVAKIMEYQRHAFMRGFVAFQGTLSGLSAWMEGCVPVNGLYDKLPSRQWSWVDPEWTVVGEEKSEGGWAYSDVIDGMYKTEKKRKDRFRRRVWQRRCLYTGRGPWIIVEAPAIRCVEVQKTNADRILVWAVTEKGQVLVRQGVTCGHPQGAIWKHIISDYNITAISVASPTCVWATTMEGRLLRRECTDQTDMECVEVSKVCLSLPKAVYIGFDHEGNVHYCDGTHIVKLERTSLLEFYVSGNIPVQGCTQFSFV